MAIERPWGNEGEAKWMEASNPHFLDLKFGPFETIHRWRRLPDCAEFVGAKRSKHTVVAYKDALYVFGGYDGKRMLNDLVCFYVKDKSWSRAVTIGTPPAPRYHHTAVVHRGSMFVFGGYTGDIHSNLNLTNKNDLFEYKFAHGQWSEHKFERRRPVPRAAHGAAVYDDKLWIFGGYDGNARLNDMWTLNLVGEGNQWTQVEQQGSIPPTRCNFALAVSGQSMFVFSGQSGAQITNDLFQFHFSSNCWTRICTEHILRGAPPPPKRYGHTMVAHDHQLYVFGGVSGQTVPNELYCYDLDSMAWSIVKHASNSQLPTERLFHAAAVVKNAMYIFGGTTDNGGRSGEIYSFQFSSYPKCTLHDDFGRLLASKQFFDVTFLVGKNKVPIKAHRALVAARSAYLMELTRKAMQHQTCSKVPDLQEQHDSMENERTPDDTQDTEDDPTKTTESSAVSADQESDASYDSIAGDNSTDVTHTTSTPAAHTSTSSTYTQHARKPTDEDESLAVSHIGMIEVELPDAEPEAFHSVLSYIYTDRINPTERHEEPVSNNVLLLMMDVNRLAIQFKMQRLEQLCMQYLEACIIDKNVLIALQNADMLELTELLEYCLRFIVLEANYTRIVYDAEFEALPKHLMVKVVRQREETPRPVTVQPLYIDNLNANTLEHDMATFLLHSGDYFCDFTLLLGDKPIRVHTPVLAARCAYFEAMFRSMMPPTRMTKIMIGDSIIPSIQSFYSLLRYIYSGDVTMPPEDSLYLYSASHFYAFTNNRLQAHCKHNLETNVSSKNVLQILEAADKIQIHDMKKHALNIIVKNYKDVSKQPALQYVRQPLLVDIVQAYADTLPDQHQQGEQ